MIELHITSLLSLFKILSLFLKVWGYPLDIRNVSMCNFCLVVTVLVVTQDTWE